MKNLLLIFLLCSSAVFAQNHERIKALKTAHITSELNLTSAEAEKFWPVYNAHEEKMHQLRRTQRDEIFDVIKGDIDNLSDEKAQALVARSIDLESKKLDYNKELVQGLTGIIPFRKILKLMKAEETFKRKLLRRMGDRKKPRH